MNSNISQMDRGVRMAAGAALIVGVLTNPFSPAWMALVAAYVVLTSIIRFEPIYALAAAVTGRSSAAKRVMPSREFALEP